MGAQHRRQLAAGAAPHPPVPSSAVSLLSHASLAQLTGLKIFQNGVGIDIIAPLANGFMITSCFAFENKMVIPSDPQSLVANNLFK